jgi:hypothetical protein
MIGFDFWPDYYHKATPHPLSVVGIIISVGIAFLIIGRRGMAAGPILIPKRFYVFSTGLQVAILSIIFIVSLVVFINDGSRWRYADEGLSVAGSPLLYFYAATPLVLRAFVLTYLMLSIRSGRQSVGLIHRVLLVAALILSVNGSASMLFSLVATLALLNIDASRRILFSFEGKKSRVKKIIRNIPLILTLLLILVLAWILGESVKRGVPAISVLAWLSDLDLLSWMTEYLVGRSGPSFVSLVVALDGYSFNYDWKVLSDHLAAPLKSFLFRLSQLVPFDILSLPRPIDGSIMRINYLMITPLPFNDREGTSPGLFAGFLYSFPFPFNFVSITLYILFVAWLIDGLARKFPGRLTTMGALAMLVLVMPLFESPIDFLLVIDDGALYLLILLFLRSWCSLAAKAQNIKPTHHI